MKPIFSQAYEYFEFAKMPIYQNGFELYVIHSNANSFVLGIEDTEHLACCDGGTTEIEITEAANPFEIALNGTYVECDSLESFLRLLSLIVYESNTRCDK